MIRSVKTWIRHANTEVLVLHVLQPVERVPPPEMAQNYAPELEDEKQPARVLVERIAEELHRAGFAAQAEVLAQWRADLITVSSQGQRSIHDLFLGNVAESVARRAGCSVAIVRPPVSN